MAGRRLDSAITIALIVVAIFSTAAFADDASDCKSEDSARSIRGCTAMLAAGAGDPAIVHFNRGTAYYFQRNYDLAIKDLSESIALNPKLENAYRNRALAYLRVREYDRTLVDIRKAMKLNPDANYNMTLFAALNGRGDYRGIVSESSRLIAKKPKDSSLYYHRGNAYAGLGNFAAAIKDYNSYIALDKEYAFAFSKRGEAKEQTGDLEGAIEDYRHALKLMGKKASKDIETVKANLVRALAAVGKAGSN